ncbi:hypothetical protein PDE_01799 [Penicillium oxalicum 114-2]|uniref:Uncharacterized protein n=1 Tax=Penicillium oxalicum (strain 114-2 / CGMCC 5302) TaxID=933388 RepID=S7Z9I4_PENO1|nr:hypothetical protein PDE_01799 [Penicillium oxalicum 114-2]
MNALVDLRDKFLGIEECPPDGTSGIHSFTREYPKLQRAFPANGVMSRRASRAGEAGTSPSRIPKNALNRTRDNPPSVFLSPTLLAVDQHALYSESR